MDLSSEINVKHSLPRQSLDTGKHTPIFRYGIVCRPGPCVLFQLGKFPVGISGQIHSGIDPQNNKLSRKMKLKYHSVYGHVPIHRARGHVLTGCVQMLRKLRAFGGFQLLNRDFLANNACVPYMFELITNENYFKWLIAVSTCTDKFGLQEGKCHQYRKSTLAHLNVHRCYHYEIKRCINRNTTMHQKYKFQFKTIVTIILDKINGCSIRNIVLESKHENLGNR